MSRSIKATLILILTAACAAAQQPQPAAVSQPNTPWVVSVVHTIEVQKMVEKMREQSKARVGVSAAAPQRVYNVATGLVVDDSGHVITRLVNLNPEDKDAKVSISMPDGRSIAARVIGIDCATGFAVLEVAALKVAAPNLATASSLANGAMVKILSTDVRSRVVAAPRGENVYLYTSLVEAPGRLKTDSLDSRVRGAITLISDTLLSRNDSSVVTTADNQIIGLAEWTGFGRANLYPIDFIRDTVAKRVIEKHGSVPAGWLGIEVKSFDEVMEAELAALGLERRAGAIVQNVEPESPAAAAGILPKDVIVGVDDADIRGPADLKAIITSSPAGRSLKLRAIRNQQPVEINVALGARLYSPQDISELIAEQRNARLSELDRLNARWQELGAVYKKYINEPPSRARDEALRELSIEIRQLLDKIRELSPGGPDKSATDKSPSQYPDVALTENTDVNFPLGFTARDLTQGLAKLYAVPGGVLVSGVLKNSAAERAGIKPGDIIVGTTAFEPLTAMQLLNALANQRGELSLKIVRADKATNTYQSLVINLNNQKN
ncbi:MAG TPA: PDZ domain-containing protein [Blastocatellia bacterium]|nr:PDZ domain-containing protein [Blastocatellia bacterium]